MGQVLTTFRCRIQQLQVDVQVYILQMYHVNAEVAIGGYDVRIQTLHKGPFINIILPVYVDLHASLQNKQALSKQQRFNM